MSSKVNQRVDNTNSSMNNGNIGSGILISSPSSITSSHCTFSNNKVFNCVCIYLPFCSGTNSMSYANIVHNNSPSQFGVVFTDGSGSGKMMNCIIQENQNYLFCEKSGSLEVSHSFIDHSSSSFSRSTAVSNTTNNSMTNRNTYQIQFFNSLHCLTDIHLMDRTLIQTVEQSPMKTTEGTPNYNDSSSNTFRLVCCFSVHYCFL